MLSRLSAVVASILVHQLHFLYAAGLLGAKPFPGLENLPRSFWHELSSPFTEVYEVESFATETGGTPEPRPFFEDPESNITVQLGAQVYMHCRVQNLLDTLKVSWVRRRGEELHLLTIGLDTYASDSRFTLAYEKPNDWRLLLSSATERDGGLYECQVSAHPPLIRTVHLTVSVPKVEIVDEHGTTAGDKFYKAGSTIELKCVVSNIPQPTGYVTWRHGSRTLNYDTTRGGIRGYILLENNGTTTKASWDCLSNGNPFNSYTVIRTYPTIMHMCNRVVLVRFIKYVLGSGKCNCG